MNHDFQKVKNEIGMDDFLCELERTVTALNVSNRLLYGQRPLVIVVDEASAFQKMKDQGVGNCC